jgi:mycothiol S-conjugate amidase
MPDSEANARPESFHMAPLDEAIGRLVAEIRRTRPQVIITYGDEQSGYPHPDHLKVHDISAPAFERAGDPAWYPEAGEPWQPSKLYYTVWSRARVVAWHQAFSDLGLQSPFDDKWFERPSHDHRITTKIPLTAELWAVRRAALLAHESQIDPDEKFWFGLPDEVQWSTYPWEDWVLALSLVGMPAEGEVEHDLFERIELAVSP